MKLRDLLLFILVPMIACMMGSCSISESENNADQPPAADTLPAEKALNPDTNTPAAEIKLPGEETSIDTFLLQEEAELELSGLEEELEPVLPEEKVKDSVYNVLEKELQRELEEEEEEPENN